MLLPQTVVPFVDVDPTLLGDVQKQLTQVSNLVELI